MKHKLIGELRAWFMRPVVVHRLPGRLRLRIPTLKGLSPEQADLADLLCDIIKAPKVILGVDVNITSGSAVIRYDQEHACESDVLELLGDVNRFVLSHGDQLAATPPNKMRAAIETLTRAAIKTLREGRRLKPGMEGDSHVWT